MMYLRIEIKPALNISMYHYPVGSITVFSGCMRSGKSSALVTAARRHLLAKRHVQVFKPGIDRRWDSLAVCTHDGVCIQATPIDSALDILTHLDDNTQVVAIDEVQFFDDMIVEVVNRLADKNIIVLCAGTDLDYEGRVFGPIGALMAIAEKVEKFEAVCTVCGGPATRNQRLLAGKPAPAGGPQILVGDAEYESRCRRCYVAPRKQTA